MRNRNFFLRTFAATAVLSTAAVAATAPTTPPPSPASPIKLVDGMPALQKVPTIFKFQAHVSQAKMPVPDAAMDVWANVRSGDTVVCSEHIPGVRVRDSVLNLEVGRQMDGCTLDDIIAVHNDLNLQVCIQSADNCLKPVAFSSVPYAFKASYAQTAARTQLADRAVLADYAQRVSADRDVLMPTATGRGYFDFQTPSNIAPLFGTEPTPSGIDRTGAGYLLWTPVNPNSTSFSIAMKGVNTDIPARLAELAFHADTTNARGNLRVSKWGVIGGGDPDGTALFTVNGGDASVHGNAMISGKATIGGDESVGGTATINVDEIVMGNVSVGANERVMGNVTVGGNEAVSGFLTCAGTANVAGTLTASSNAVIGAGGANALLVHGGASVDATMTAASVASTGDMSVQTSFVDRGTASFAGTATFAGASQFNGNVQFGANGASSSTVDVYDTVAFHGAVTGLPVAVPDPTRFPDATMNGTVLRPATLPWDRMAPDVTTAIQAIVTQQLGAHEKRIVELELRNDMLWASGLLTDTSVNGIAWATAQPDGGAAQNFVLVTLTAGRAQASDEVGNVAQRCLCRKKSTLVLSSQSSLPSSCTQVCGADGALPGTPQWTLGEGSSTVPQLLTAAGVTSAWIWLSDAGHEGTFTPVKSSLETYSKALAARPQ